MGGGKIPRNDVNEFHLEDPEPDCLSAGLENIVLEVQESSRSGQPDIGTAFLLYSSYGFTDYWPASRIVFKLVVAGSYQQDAGGKGSSVPVVRALV